MAAPTVCVAGTNVSDTFDGWILGGGVAFAFAGNFIGRIEYLHADYGTTRFPTPGTIGGATDVSIKGDKVRAGLSLKFGP